MASSGPSNRDPTEAATWAGSTAAMLEPIEVGAWFMRALACRFCGCGRGPMVSPSEIPLPVWRGPWTAEMLAGAPP